MWSSPHLSPTPSPPNCHPERSEGSSGYLPREMLHFVQHDSGERSGSTPCGHRHISRRPHPRPIVILNEVKDPPAACPERCFTSFSMTKVNDRGRLRVVAATSLRPPTPRPVVILNEVKDLPAAWPERCFTSFSMTVMDSRDRRRHHHPLTHSPTPTESQPCHSRSAQTPPASTFLPPWRAGRRTRRESWHGRRRSRCRRRPTGRW